MDVGFNNRNNLHIALDNKMFEDVEWLVEANSNETQELWAQWCNQSMSNYSNLKVSDKDAEIMFISLGAKALELGFGDELAKMVELNKKINEDRKHRRNWEQVYTGYWYTIVELECNIPGDEKKKKLPVNISFQFFIIEGHKIAFYCSDSALTHNFYIEAFLKTHFQRTHDGYTRWNHTNAQNFHNCINYFDTVDKEPRDTIYEPDDFMKDYYIFK